jgi:hypothetical protein
MRDLKVYCTLTIITGTVLNFFGLGLFFSLSLMIYVRLLLAGVSTYLLWFFSGFLVIEILLLAVYWLVYKTAETILHQILVIQQKQGWVPKKAK